MKWIKVVDINRAAPIGNTMRRHLYERLVEMTRTLPDHTITGVVILKLELREDVRSGALRTRCDAWEYSLRYHFPWLKEHQYIETDKPYKPRPWQRGDSYDSMAYKFSENSPRSVKAKHLVQLWERFGGQTWEKLSLRELLLSESHGSKTAWDYFKANTSRLICADLLRIIPLDREGDSKYRKIYGLRRWEEGCRGPLLSSYRYKPIVWRFESKYQPYYWATLPSGGVLPEIFNRYAGMEVEQWQLFVDLVRLRLPNGAADLWSVWKHYETQLERENLIYKVSGCDDSILRMKAILKEQEVRPKIQEARRKALENLKRIEP